MTASTFTRADLATDGKPYGQYIAQSPFATYVVVAWNPERYSVCSVSDGFAIRLQNEGTRYVSQTIPAEVITA